jgi:hypothetical protein
VPQHFSSGFGEFSNTHNTELALQLIGFILVLNSTIFAIITFIFKNRLLRNDLFKLLLTVLIYDLIAIIFMISGWNESKKAGYSFNWAFHFLFAGFILFHSNYFISLKSILNRSYRRVW